MTLKKALTVLVLLSSFLVGIYAIAEEQDPFNKIFRIYLSDYDEKGEENGIKKLMFYIDCDIAKGYHIYADSLKIDLSFDSDFRITKKEFPEPAKRFDKFLKKFTNVYYGKNTIIYNVDLPNFERIKNSTVKVKFSAVYEGRSNSFRYPARKISYDDTIDFKEKSFISKIEDSLKNLGKKGFLLGIISTFFLGMLASLTPCVYPIIPIVVSTIGSKSINRKIKGFALSLLFSLGIALVYSTGGFIAARSGSVLGSFFQSDWAVLAVALVFLSMGLSLIGLFELRLPHFVTKGISGFRGEGYVGMLVTGMITGLIAVPCVGPFAASLLTFAAESGNAVKGFSLLLSFSIGLSMLFLVVGTFSSLLTMLPKPGIWMVLLKKILGLILLGVSLYYVGQMIPEKIYPVVIGLVLIFMAFILRKMDTMNSKAVALFQKKVSQIFTIAGVFIVAFVPLFSYLHADLGKLKETAPTEKIKWLHSYDEALRTAKELNKPLMMDFYADWCGACKQLEKKAFSSKNVIDKSKQFITLKIDLTKKIYDPTNRITLKYAVYSLPVVLFLTPKADILESYRITNSVDAEYLGETMDKVLASLKDNQTGKLERVNF